MHMLVQLLERPDWLELTLNDGVVSNGWVEIEDGPWR